MAAIGHLKGAVKGNRHVVLQEQPTANFLLTLARLYGVDTDSFGISTGSIEL
jgi:hypothetical protein